MIRCPRAKKGGTFLQTVGCSRPAGCAAVNDDVFHFVGFSLGPHGGEQIFQDGQDAQTKHRGNIWENDTKEWLVGGLEHDWLIFPYIGNNHPNWLDQLWFSIQQQTVWFDLTYCHWVTSHLSGGGQALGTPMSLLVYPLVLDLGSSSIQSSPLG